jgi:hypothetical protein
MASHAREPEPRKPVGTLYRRGAKGKCNRQHRWQSLPLSLSRHRVTRKRPTFFSLARRTLHPVWEYPSLVFKAAGTRRRLFPIGVQCSAIIITLRAHCGNNRRFPIRLSAENVVEGTPWFIQRLKSAERMLTYLHRRGVNVKKWRRGEAGTGPRREHGRIRSCERDTAAGRGPEREIRKRRLAPALCPDWRPVPSACAVVRQEQLATHRTKVGDE